ncbi:amino acid--tRNA ligase-related protein [Steroidobacter cummioxidans]|uniref:amino acid--tRNA ligase-related protein n=1 Tax=Steroidobacter cummioxidans TaxID=1803913 RepID=UPI002AC37078|nr:amino acid--tRNA ligase-related protein [Steroidobacter cummioxidans]
MFPRLTFQEAARILRDDSRYVIRMENWRTLNRAGERELMRYCGGAVWVTHWDHLAVPFYQAFAEDGSACNADLLIGVGEVIGLGQRHSDGAQVRRALDLHQVEQGAYQWYIDLKDQKPLLTSGFGMGVERYLLWLLSHSDIRDLQLLPRMNGYSIIP